MNEKNESAATVMERSTAPQGHLAPQGAQGCVSAPPHGVNASPEASAWWALVMGAAASIEDAANCLSDADAKKQADGAAKHYREAAQKLMHADGVKNAKVIQCTQCLAVTNEGNGCAQEGCPVGLKVTQGPRVLNALEVLEKAALGPESQGTAAQFLKCLGDSGMWVIENPLAPGVLASEAPRYFCKKCGYVGIPGDAAPLHERPNGTGQCGYMAVPMQAAAGVEGKTK